MTNRSLKTRSRTRRWIANILFVAGAALLGAWAYSNLRGKVYQDWENWAFDRRVNGQAPALRDYLGEKKDEILDAIRGKPAHRRAAEPAVPQPQAAIPAKPPVSLRNGEVLGRLVVPRLGLHAVVREGTGEDTLSLALGHIPGTALPGQNGNIGVAGHRDTLFRSLRQIRKSDLIEFQTLDGEHLYQVRSTEVVSPRRTSVLNASLRPEITLVTCYPFYYVGPAPDRFVVKAEEIVAGTGAVQPPPVQRAAVREPDIPATPRGRAWDRQKRHAAGIGQEGTDRAEANRIGERRVPFEVFENHSRELARGISIGLSGTDPYSQSVTGWMWIMPDRRTIWLRNQRAQDAIVFFGHDDGKLRKLVITSVGARSVKGYLLVPEGIALSAKAFR
jgi:sortase A